MSDAKAIKAATYLAIACVLVACDDAEKCRALVRETVVLDYEKNGSIQAANHYSKRGLTFIKYTSSVDVVPVLGKTQVEVADVINNSSVQAQLFPVNVQDIDKSCDDEFMKFDAYAKEWNGYMFGKAVRIR